MTMFCVECGSEERLYGHICRKCLMSKDLIVAPEYTVVQVCGSCGRVLDGAAWKFTSHEDVAAGILTKETHAHSQVQSFRWVIPDFPPEKGEHRLKCTAIAIIGGEELEQQFDLIIRIRFNNCPSCSRQSGDYYEAIIQLRIDGLLARDASAELAEEHNTILDMVDEAAETDEKAFLTKKTPVQGGIDYYIGSVTLGRAIAAKMRARYGASVTESPSVVGQKDGNDMFRNSIRVKLPALREGDIVTFNKKIHVVETSDSKMLVLKNAANGQIVRTSPDDAKVKHVAKFRDIRQAVVVSHDSSGIQVLDPDTMVAVTLSKPPYMKNIGETVPVIRYDDALYIV